MEQKHTAAETPIPRQSEKSEKPVSPIHPEHPEHPHFHIHVGLRTVKTALAVALCALVYYFFDRSPAFACIGAIFGLGYDMADSRLNGGNRLFGTIIGGVIGILMYRIHLIFYPNGEHSLLLVLLAAIGTVLLILLCQRFWVGGVQPGGVVLCILLFNTPVETYISYALNRIFDTGVGVVAALLINHFFPRERLEKWLHKKLNNAE